MVQLLVQLSVRTVTISVLSMIPLLIRFQIQVRHVKPVPKNMFGPAQVLRAVKAMSKSKRKTVERSREEIVPCLAVACWLLLSEAGAVAGADFFGECWGELKRWQVGKSKDCAGDKRNKL